MRAKARKVDDVARQSGLVWTGGDVTLDKKAVLRIRASVRPRARNWANMKCSLKLASAGLVLILAMVVSGRDTGLASLCYVDGVDSFVPLSECLRWARNNGHRMFGEEDSKGQEVTWGDIGNHVDEGYQLSEEDKLPVEWNTYN